MTCQDCEEEVDELITVTVARKNLNLCEECAEVREEQAAISDDAESAMQGMMEYKGH